MKIEDLKKELVRIESEFVKFHEKERSRANAMLEALLCTIMPTEKNETKLVKFLKLIMSCPDAGKNKRQLMEYVTFIISSDYLLSIREGKKAMPFLNRPLKLYCEWMGESPVLEIQETSAFINEFRATYLKGQKGRKNQAIYHIYICHEAAHRLDIPLHLEELLEDVPTSWHINTFFQILIMALVSGHLLSIPLAESMAPWRAANKSGTPISIFDAWQPMDEPLLYAGVVMLLLTIGYTLWLGTKSYISLMAKMAYWKFNR